MIATRPRRPRLRLEELEGRALLAVVPLALVNGHLAVAPPPAVTASTYAFTLTQPSRVTARVATLAGDFRLSLHAADGTLLVQSDGLSPTNRDDRLDVHLAGGATYLVRLEPLGGIAAGTLTLDASVATPPGQRLPAGGIPWGNVGDFNLDGVLDLVTANYSTNDVSVLLGVGDGTFAPEVRYAVDARPMDVTVADLDGDGHLDLATPNYGGASISILHGLGDGRFASSVTVPVGAVSAAIASTDLDRDGRIDLAVVDQDTNELVVLLQAADGTYPTQARFAVGESPYDLFVGDFNNDAVPDMATANNASNDVTVLFGVGDGSFQYAATYAVGESPYIIITDDIDRDGRVDLLTANTDSGDVSILYGYADGTFAPAVSVPSGPGVTALAVEDFNADGLRDLAVTNAYSGTVSILLGVGTRRFQPVAPLVVGNHPTFLFARDFSGDGNIDLYYGTYAGLDVSVALGRGDGSFQLPAHANQGAGVDAVAAGDLNHDGRPDLVAVSFAGGGASVYLGRADGTFQPLGQYANGSDPIAVALADLDGDGRLDLVLTDQSSRDLSVSLGHGDGTFGVPVFFAVGAGPQHVLAADFNHDGALDLATANSGSSNVSVLLGDGRGSFQPSLTFATGGGPNHLAAADFDGDGVLDLVSADYRAGTVSVLFGVGDGTFLPARSLAAGPTPTAVAAGDLDRDGVADLVVTSDAGVGVFLARPGTPTGFLARADYQAGGAGGMAVGRFDGDSYLDVATTDFRGNSITVLAGRGDGTLGPASTQATGGVNPFSVVTADFDLDGTTDLAVGNLTSSDFTVFHGWTAGGFRHARRTVVASLATDLLLADINHDGFLDGIATGYTQGLLYTSIGGRELPLTPTAFVPIGAGPVAVVQGDFNHDGRLDVATANQLDHTLTVLLGRGDGSFNPGFVLSVHRNPTALVAADFDGDGYLDLAATSSAEGVVCLLRGRGDGTFWEDECYAVGEGPAAMAAADLNRDGFLDLIFGNALSRSVSVLYGQSNGRFGPATHTPLPGGPTALVVGDLDADGWLDVAATATGSDSILVLLQRQGRLTLTAPLAAAGGPVAPVLGDFNGDGRLDLAAALGNANSVQVWLGVGGGAFQAGARVAVGHYPNLLQARDLSGDGVLDLLVINSLGTPATLAVGRGDGTFGVGMLESFPARSEPLVADLNHDGLKDVVILQQTGVILARLGENPAAGTLAPPFPVNPNPGDAARDVTLFHRGNETLLAAIDTRSPTVSLYALHGEAFERTESVAVPAPLPVRLIAGDLNGDTRRDLVVATATGQLFVYTQAADGTFTVPSAAVAIGMATTDISLRDLDGDGLKDILVLDGYSGDLRVFVNAAVNPFATAYRYRAGVALTEVIDSHGLPVVHSQDGPAALVAANFDDAPGLDVVVAHSGSRQVTLLSGNGRGGFDNVVAPAGLHRMPEPSAAAAGDLNGDGRPDLVVLEATTGAMCVYLNQPGVGLTCWGSIPGSAKPGSTYASGVSLVDLNGDGRLDVLVGNSHGDVLTLMGNGDGTFQPYRRVEQRLALATADLNGDGRTDFAFANQGQDQLGVRISGAGRETLRDRDQGILDPGQVKLADLNADGLPDMVVVNGGTNMVLVFLGLPGGEFTAPRSYFAGTRPAGVTLSDLNRDGRLDLVVANQGSNDVSILLGQGSGAGYTLTPGPRLEVGAGPVFTLVRDLDADGIADLLVSNARAGTVSLLPGVGSGYFDDRRPVTFVTGRSPTQLAVGYFDALPGLDLVSLDAGVKELSFFSGLRGERRVIHAGSDPIAFLSGDFDHDGFGDLVVASRDESRLVLLAGGDAGPVFVSSLSGGGMVRPADLALAALNAGSLDLYVLMESQEIARLTFVFDAETPSVPPPSDAAPTLGQVVSDYSSLGSALFSGVAMLALMPDGWTPGEAAAPPADPNTGGRVADEAVAPLTGGEPAVVEMEPVAHGEAGPPTEEAEVSPEVLRLNGFILGVDQLPFVDRFRDAVRRDDAGPLEALDEAFRLWEEPPTDEVVPQPPELLPMPATDPADLPASLLLLCAAGLPALQSSSPLASNPRRPRRKR